MRRIRRKCYSLWVEESDKEDETGQCSKLWDVVNGRCEKY